MTHCPNRILGGSGVACSAAHWMTDTPHATDASCN